MITLSCSESLDEISMNTHDLEPRGPWTVNYTGTQSFRKTLDFFKIIIDWFERSVSKPFNYKS